VGVRNRLVVVLDLALDSALTVMVVVIVMGPASVSADAGDEGIPGLVDVCWVAWVVELDLNDLAADGVEGSPNHKSFSLSNIGNVDRDDITGEEFVVSHDSGALRGDERNVVVR